MIPNPSASRLTVGSESLILIRMTWSESFTAYITKRFPENPQKEAALSMKISPSSVHYWCNGATPREARRKKIAKWSKGEVPVTVPIHLPATGTDG